MVVSLVIFNTDLQKEKISTILTMISVTFLRVTNKGNIKYLSKLRKKWLFYEYYAFFRMNKNKL